MRDLDSLGMLSDVNERFILIPLAALLTRCRLEYRQRSEGGGVVPGVLWLQVNPKLVTTRPLPYTYMV